MKEKTFKLVNNKLELLMNAVDKQDKLKCIEIYNSIPGTGWNYFIDEIVNRGIGRVEGAFLKWRFEE